MPFHDRAASKAIAEGKSAAVFHAAAQRRANATMVAERLEKLENTSINKWP